MSETTPQTQVSSKHNIKQDEIDPSKWEYSDEEMSAFNIDKRQENMLVRQFQTTGDIKLLETLYKMREPTLRVWAKKSFYIGDSEDDVFSELTQVWRRCIKKYEITPEVRPLRTKKGGFILDENGNRKTTLRTTPFNTYLFTAIRNHISNVNKKRYSRKRLDHEGKPIDRNMVPLDMSIDEESGRSIHDTVAADGHHVSSAINTQSIIATVSDGDQEVARVLMIFAANPKMKHISTACNLKEGVIKITAKEAHLAKKMAGKDIRKWVLEKVSETTSYRNAKLVEYELDGRSLKYEVTVKDINLIRKVKEHIAAAQNKV